MKKEHPASARLVISRRANIILNIILLTWSLLCVIPFVLLISTSFTDESTIVKFGYNFIPKLFSLDAYKYLFTSNSNIFNSFGVTIFVTIVGTAMSTIIIALYAYAASRKVLRYRQFFTLFAAFTMLFSGGLVPYYILCTRYLHLKNSIWAMILPNLMNVFWMVVMKTFFVQSVPDSLIESAKIDGASEMRIFRKIVLPLAKPGIATIALFTTFNYWNDYYLPLLFINDSKLYNLQYTIYTMLTNAQFLKNFTKLSGQAASLAASVPTESVRMAMAVITVVPILIIYPFFQKYFVAGLTIGSVKE